MHIVDNGLKKVVITVVSLQTWKKNQLHELRGVQLKKDFPPNLSFFRHIWPNLNVWIHIVITKNTKSVFFYTFCWNLEAVKLNNLGNKKNIQLSRLSNIFWQSIRFRSIQKVTWCYNTQLPPNKRYCLLIGWNSNY